MVPCGPWPLSVDRPCALQYSVGQLVQFKKTPVGEEPSMDAMQFAEVIRFAIEKEQEAADAYTPASATVDSPNVRNMLLELAAEERSHKEKPEQIDRGKVAASAIEAVPHLKVADYAVSGEVSSEMDYQDVLLVAIRREEKAHNLYSLLASSPSEPELKRLFGCLAQEEAKHKLTLEKEYDEQILTDN